MHRILIFFIYLFFFYYYFFFFEIRKIQGYIAQSDKDKLQKEKEAKITQLTVKLKKLEAQIKEPKKQK